jgi:hypothetical protein
VFRKIKSFVEGKALLDEGRRYSCPIPPAENHLPVEVKAGVKEGFRTFRKF